MGFPRQGRSTERGEGQKPDDTNSADGTLSKPDQPPSGPESAPEASEVDPPEMAPVLEDLAAAAEMEAEPENRRDLTMVRRIAVTAWFVLMGVHIALEGLAFDRTRLIILMCLGLAAASIGRRRFITIILDWAPFALILILYDWTRNIAQVVGMPTHWNLAIDFDAFLFGGITPTAWLQENLKQASPPWWEVIVSVVYMSYFIIPYAVAAWLWLKDRAAWRRYAACFVATTFLALVGYTLVPGAPPWAAARCTAAEVQDYPRDPICMYEPVAKEPGGLLGPLDNAHPDAEPYVERISARGWNYLNIHAASNLVTLGQGKSNLVAAIPSLHAGLTMLLALFMWPRVKALGKTLFMGYAFAMAFALVYSAEHYVFDIVLGWALAAAVIAVYQIVDRKYLIPRQKRLAAEAEAAGTESAETEAAGTESDREDPDAEKVSTPAS
ncbi:phosphatase PAP2 family protein [Gordonia amicalis]|uniref:phosphatase PAP2 family protein n=1 Tax=Gordonia amicalis TaxID=89053 RepID=UPI0022B40865|nr:phosphatase PAP2 family protein [Gordonia amicalis]MCZ4579008.1 phosphatase PAP2 family protein [Gordonia amicalis]